MSPSWKNDLRRYGLLVAAILLFLVFSIVDLAWFRPAAARYDEALKQAGNVGLALEPEHAQPMIPPRLFALISDNALPAATAEEQGNSGELTAELLGDLAKLTGKHGIMVLTTEPGQLTQLPQSIQVRAHLRGRCRYAEFVALLDEMARGQALFSVDRFSYAAQPTGDAILELWVSRFVLKQQKSR